MPAASSPDSFLTELHKMFERTKAKGAISLTTKRSKKEKGEDGMIDDFEIVFFSSSSTPTDLEEPTFFPFRSKPQLPPTANLKSRNTRKPDPVSMWRKKRKRE